MDSCDESFDDLMSTKMSEDFCDRIQSLPKINRREARYKTRDCIKEIQSKCKVALKSTQNRGKGLHKVFKNIVKEISQDLPLLG